MIILEHYPKKLNSKYLLGFVFGSLFLSGEGQSSNSISKDTASSLSEVWVADNGDGTYKNPILYADYSDPDVIRVGDDYYMTASSFNCVPGLPVLHSKDLVSWNLIGYALQKLAPLGVFDKPQPGNGVWAPCMRYHHNEFYIYFPDPDRGIFLVKASKPEGPWSDPILVKEGKGLIDPSPLWDDDGNAYMVFAFAGSRAGIKSVLIISRMNAEGTLMYDDGVIIFDGHQTNSTVEGPKFYKRNGYYYIFAPAGGVTNGWQLALRSRNIYGPYEDKVVLNRGNTTINGPHQGAWVDTPEGEDWFIHFQDKDAYGRIVHLQPMKWSNDWPLIGIDQNGDGIGEPVTSFRKPDVGKTFPPATPPENDEFNGFAMGLQWQWMANPSIKWGYSSGNLGFYRLNCIPRPENYNSLWDVPNLLLQKFPSKEYIATAALTFNARFDGEETGMVIMGKDYQYISLKRSEGKLYIKVVCCKDAAKKGTEKTLYSCETKESKIIFKIKVGDGALCSFSYSIDGKTFINAGNVFRASPGIWIGAKVGFFALRDGFNNDAGNVDIDWFRVEKTN
jgi:beta-xylosidase